MKAVIMAGGKGTRLRPLTCNLPKPMVPILEKPVMEYTIELLKKYGITEIAVTVQYLPEHIKEYFGNGSHFGVDLHYFEETTPLGTAGSIKNAESFLNERFIVISGDALTDFDLQTGINFHQEKEALVTIFMKQVENPLEYGVIMTDKDQRIIRFFEKPSWNEVFSDTVNTGIYVLEPEVFNYLSAGVPTDFSKDLFPLLMKEHKPLYGYPAEGYWSDIGSLSQYRKSHEDFLDGQINLPLPGKEVLPGLRIGENVVIEHHASIKTPAYIGSGTTVRQNAKIYPYTVIGSNSIISSNASLKRSILWNDVYVGANSELRGSTIANGTFIGEGTSMFEHSVIGNQVQVGKKVTVKPEVKVWPKKEIVDNSTIHTSLIWSKRISRSLFTNRSIRGIANIEITPDFAARVASAYGACLMQGKKLAIASDNHPFSQLILQSFEQGLHSSGIHTVDLSPSLSPILRYSVEKEGWAGGAFIRFGNQQTAIEFYDEDGYPVSTDFERKIENAFWQEDYRRAPYDRIGMQESDHSKNEEYEKAILQRINQSNIQACEFKIVTNIASKSHDSAVSRVLERLKCQIVSIPMNTTATQMHGVLNVTDAHLGVWIDETGEKLKLLTEEGDWLSDDQLLSLYVLLSLGDLEFDEYAIPVYGSSELDHLADSLRGKLVRTKADARSIMKIGGTVLNVQYDAILALTSILNMMANQQKPLSQLVKMLPNTKLIREQVECPSRVKGRVMRRLMEETRDQMTDLVDGIKVYHPNGGWTLILPDIVDPTFTVYSQAPDLEFARRTSESFIHKIKTFQQM
ncbi:sugar phosphate nucleotidyltransferase [Pseudalkalibacillus salsuginis]|uniref:sugar phosphate nucleotidyltransferase n=1 Tax=Pseudalkalibacillus salsuginis TaxID=2910972 RepID=UPI001F4373F9|nr:sugar phosphate nucleotidyltransferase [Pseudalkalibacillus salsuginis]MCF6408477.1 NTP transferase domain-containing protein [Pseudalkalibacillus salsuginis]